GSLPVRSNTTMPRPVHYKAATLPSFLRTPPQNQGRKDLPSEGPRHCQNPTEDNQKRRKRFPSTPRSTNTHTRHASGSGPLTPLEKNTAPPEIPRKPARRISSASTWDHR